MRTFGGPLVANVARTFDGYSPNFAPQAGTATSWNVPNGVAALALNVYAVSPTNVGFIKVWPASGTEPAVSTVSHQPGLIAMATGALVPVDQATSNRFTAKSAAVVDFVADVVGYFRSPDGTIGDITAVTVGAGLTGGGSIGAVTLEIAAGGIGTGQLADHAAASSKLALTPVGASQLTDNSVTTANVTNASMTKPKLSAGGGTAGQLLATNGTNLQRVPAPATVTPINPLRNTIITQDATGTVGINAAVALGTDGVPVVSYGDATSGTLKVAKCGNAACTEMSTLTVVDTICSSPTYHAAFTSIAVGANGRW